MRISLLALLVLLPSVAVAGAADKRLDIYWIDVEGGAATLVVTPAGQSILFDTGFARFAGRIHEHMLDVAKVSRIDYLVTTHYDTDHYQGAVPLSRLFPVINLVDNGRFEGMRNDPGEKYFTINAQKRIVINPGDEIPLTQTAGTPALKLRCIATRQEFMSPPNGAGQNGADQNRVGKNQAACERIEATMKDPDPSENANSTVFVLEFGSFRFFDAGDLTWNLESKLVCPVDLVGKVDVYQVTHHGLDRSNHPAVIRTLQPTISVMNNGPKKGTAEEVIRNLKRTKSIQTMYQLHENERPDGVINNTHAEFIANPAGVTGNYLQVSVDPDGVNYTVMIPSNGHQQKYQTTEK